MKAISPVMGMAPWASVNGKGSFGVTAVMLTWGKLCSGGGLGVCGQERGGGECMQTAKATAMGNECCSTHVMPKP